MNIFKYKHNTPGKLSATFFAIVLILTSISAIILFTIPVRACHYVGTFESDYVTPKTTFLPGEIVYGKGGNNVNGYYKLRIRDPSGNVVYYSNPVFEMQVTCSYFLDDDAPNGKWDIQLGELLGGSWNWSWIACFDVIAQPKYTLTININSIGTVTKDPDQTTYTNGTLVQLIANPDTGWTFSHWSGDLNSNDNPETINMTADKNITAHFKKKSTNGGGSNGGGSNGGGSNGGVTSTGGKVENDDSGKSTAENLPPIADLSAGEPYPGFVNSEITFNGSLSYDPDEYIISWKWDFGDGSNGEGEMANHSYPTAGTYTVILTVTDNSGATNDSETSVLVIQPNRPPSNPEINGPTKGKKGIDYSYTVVSTDDDNDSVKYVIDWGDGNIDASEFLPNGTIITITHKWISAGSYTIKVIANDNQTISSSELTIIIEEPVVPEESNLALLALALLVLILLTLFLILSKKKKGKTK